MPKEIREVFRSNFAYPESSVYMQVATSSNDIPTIRTLRLYEISKNGELIFLSHTQTRKWIDLAKNSRIAVHGLDKYNNQLLSSGDASLVIPADSIKYKFYWDKLGDDGKKLYSGPAPNQKMENDPPYSIPKKIPLTFGVIIVRSNFYEWYQVNWKNLIKSARIQLFFKKDKWIRQRVHAA